MAIGGPNEGLFSAFLGTARMFWGNNVLVPGERVILVEAMSQALRVTLRNMTVANSLRRLEPARIIVYSGADEDWNQVVWTRFNYDEISRLVIAYGAEEIFDIHSLVDQRVRGEQVDLSVGGVQLGGELPEAGISQAAFDQVVDSTTCRMARVARVLDTEEHRAKREVVRARSAEFAKVYDALMERFDVVALVSSHVDYNNFGLAVESALRHDVPVLFPQSTGNLKCYAIFPERHDPQRPIRASLTEDIGEFFEKHVWANREVIAPSRELTMSRSKVTLGRPSWWRPGGEHSSIEMRTPADRAAVRVRAARRLGLDPAKPTITVYNHAVSDAIGTNYEAFADLGEWFEETARWAAEHDECNWLFLDHPQQWMYDATDFAAGVAARHVEHDHMVFMPSMDLSKNSQVALTDLVLTVRGSVATEYPALGIPALLAGWSEASACGFVSVTETPEEYFAALAEHIDALRAGRPLLTEEQVERARLYTWWYRSGADVNSNLVQHWQFGETSRLWMILRIIMMQVEADSEPAFTAVRRMWRRREAFLTRFDWTTDSVADEIAPVADRAGHPASDEVDDPMGVR